jgi:uncharacterized protein (TIGR00255 family)
MTAFAAARAHGDGVEVACELRSVNHRYLDLAFRLPDALRALEPALRERLRARLARGRVEVALRVVADDRRTLEVDGAMLAALTAAIVRLRADHPFLAAPTALDVLRWPGVVVDTGADAAPPAAALAAVDAALDALDAARLREGAALVAAIEQRLAAIAGLVDGLLPLAAGLGSALRDRLRARLADLGAGVDDVRLAQEVAVAAQRADVAEELDRLNAHVREVRAAIAAGEPVGRRLDFLAQEMHREANTLSAKAGGAWGDRIVELKVQVEQVREQVQNVE